MCVAVQPVFFSPPSSSTLSLPLLIYPAPCCRPPRRRAMAPLVLGTLRATRQAPSATSTCAGCSISDRWTLSLPCGRCFTCSHHHRESTATSTTGNRPRTSGPGTTLLSWSCSASGYVVSLYSSNFGQVWMIKSVCLWGGTSCLLCQFDYI